MLPNQKLTETLAEQNQQLETAAPAKKFFNFSFKRKIKAKGGVDTIIVIRYIYPLTILVIVGILVWFFSFLYNNVYLTMAQAEVVSGLKMRVISEKLNKDKFNEIIKNIADKNTLANWTKASVLKSPFVLGIRNNYLNTAASNPPLTATSTSSTLPIINSSTPATITATATKITTTKATTTKK